MKCIALEVKNVSGKWPVVEIGAPFVGNGDVILLKEGKAAHKFATSYANFLNELGTVEREKLRGTTYEVMTGAAFKGKKQSAVSTPAEAPAPKVADKSMKNKAKKKAKANKKG